MVPDQCLEPGVDVNVLLPLKEGDHAEANACKAFLCFLKGLLCGKILPP